jgi:CheY-like chemotaxis protein
MAGARVSVAASGADALAAIDRELPDLLVSDVGMPRMDGYQLLERLRARPRDRGGDVPAVALTAYAQQADRTRARAAGFQRHVAKPVEPSALLAALASLLG